MKKKTYIFLGLISTLAFFTGCSLNSEPVLAPVEETVQETEVEIVGKVKNDDEIKSEEKTEEPEAVKEESESVPEDGVYLAEFNTDSTMFHANEMCDGKGELTVKDGVMTIHISLPSKSILNLYSGLAEDAQKDGAVLLQPSIDVIDYNDGTAEEVHGFDIPVPFLDEEFDVALIGTKGKWYDHKVSVSNPVVKTESSDSAASDTKEVSENVEDGTIAVELEGGSGKATITSPALIKKTENGYILTVEWSSPNYDYMIVNGEKYLPVNTDGNSVFEIPLASFDEDLNVTADTVAMSKPHEIEYTIRFLKD
ncbi:MAG: iron transporter [Lachnospiraceae bacterium]|nr:iron transporter [Lachnospiraceae bacterium]